MFEIMLFLHLAGLAVWFGASMASAFVLILAKRKITSSETKTFVRKALRAFGWLTHPSSIVVLVSGIIMIVNMNWGDLDKPLWLTYMERGGGMIIIVAIALTAILSRKIVKRLDSASHSSSEVAVGGGLYLTSLLAILVAILSVILVVSLRLS